MIKLKDIGIKYRTDKVDNGHTVNGVCYLDNYEFHFEELRNKSVKVLEIGVLGGGSIRTWKEYFHNGKIYGLDIDPSRKFTEERIHIDIGSQNDIEFLKKTYSDIQFDIIIDDGAHVNEMIINSFKYLFYNNLKPGGIYVIEDLLCTYEPAYKGWPGMSYNTEPSVSGVMNGISFGTMDGEWFVNRREDMDVFFNQIIADMDKRSGDIQSISFYSMMSFIRKKL
jgi:hypothetical protein